jgi:hypothetical protein
VAGNRYPYRDTLQNCPMVALSGALLIPNQIVQLSVVAIHHFQTKKTKVL